MIERYSRKVMRDVWTEQNKFSAYLKVEILASEAWSKLGVVPAEDVEKLWCISLFSFFLKISLFFRGKFPPYLDFCRFSL